MFQSAKINALLPLFYWKFFHYHLLDATNISGDCRDYFYVLFDIKLIKSLVNANFVNHILLSFQFFTFPPHKDTKNCSTYARALLRQLLLEY